jgi:hypothetical protein
MLETEQKLVFLGSRKGLFREPLAPHVSVCHDRHDVEAAIANPTKRMTWISFSRDFTDILLEKAIESRADFRGSRLITLAPPRSESIAALVGLFQPVFGLVEGFRWLPKRELVEALSYVDSADRFIGGSVDAKARAVTLLRGDVKAVVVPFGVFRESRDGTAPDFTRLRLTDYGRTVALGEYEAAADAILYEVDSGYRRRLKKQRRQSARTFGASLTRLRKQRGLKRNDFAPVSSKEIARIERDEIGKPHRKTLETIAHRLGVLAEEIDSY